MKRVANAKVASTWRAAGGVLWSVDSSEADQSSAHEALAHQQTPDQRMISHAIFGRNGETRVRA
jgi:hypothetical protein